MTIDAGEQAFTLFDRDAHGTSYSVEVVESTAWQERFLTPPEPERADVRIVRLVEGVAPDELPRWLAIERRVAATEGETAVAEERGAYVAGEAPPMAETLTTARRLWPWSPHHRTPANTVQEYIAAAAAAIRHPLPGTANAERAMETVVEFADGRATPLGELARLRAEALERWLAARFGDPDRLAFEVLLARIEDDGATEVVRLLRFVGDAELKGGGADAGREVDTRLAELSLDRQAVLAQASPWRYFGGELERALPAARSWQVRYRLAYEQHYRDCLVEAAELRPRLDAAAQAVEALERLNRVAAFGPRSGEVAAASLQRARDWLSALPEGLDPEAPRTAGIVLGERPPALTDGEQAVVRVQQALEAKRSRFAAIVAALALERSGVPALDRLLHVIAASGLGTIERVLDEALIALIERLIEGAPLSPLEELARRHPSVTMESLDEVAADARALLLAAIESEPEGRVVLREDRA